MSDPAEILFANDTFYHLFRTRDLEGMDQIWSKREGVACLHPGWPALTSRDEVMESWQGIFSNPQAPQVKLRDARAFLVGVQGFVVCYEIVDQSVLAATNIFVQEDGAWKLMHHHAGPCNLAPGDLEGEEEPVPLQ